MAKSSSKFAVVGWVLFFLHVVSQQYLQGSDNLNKYTPLITTPFVNPLSKTEGTTKFASLSSSWTQAFETQHLPAHQVAIPGARNKTACVYGYTRLFISDTATENFATSLLTVLRDVSLRSFNDAMQGTGKIHIVAPIATYRPPFSSLDDILDFLKPVVDTYGKLSFDFRPNATLSAQTAFESTTCSWVLSVNLDADDVIAPGIVDWMLRDVIPTLDYGAVVGCQTNSQIQYAAGRCVGKVQRKAVFFSGQAQGQTRIFSRELFSALGRPIQSIGHSHALIQYRKDVFEKFLKLPIPASLKSGGKARGNYKEQAAVDDELAVASGIKMVETKEFGFGMAGIYLQTLLSGHVMFHSIVNEPQCTPAQWNKTIWDATDSGAKRWNVDYALDSLIRANITLYDLCKSNLFFQRAQNERKQVGLYGATCEEMEVNFQVKLTGDLTVMTAEAQSSVNPSAVLMPAIPAAVGTLSTVSTTNGVPPAVLLDHQIAIPESNETACIYGYTKYFVGEMSTKNFAMSLLTVLRDVSLRSFNCALQGIGKIHILAPISKYEPHFSSLDDILEFLKPVLDTYDKLSVDFTAGAIPAAKDDFDSTTCKWVLSINLDADDIIAPGIVDWMVKEVVPTLENGAIVGCQTNSHIHYGFDRCVGTVQSKPTFFSGQAQGQTRIFSRELFNALGRPLSALGHAHALLDYRKVVFEKFLKQPVPASLTDKGTRGSYGKQSAMDNELEKASGIKMVETSKSGFGMSGIYMHTLLSGHFLFNSIGTNPRCTQEQWNKTIVGATPNGAARWDVDHVLDSLIHANITLYDLCKSNLFFQRAQKERKQEGLFGANCEEMETDFQVKLASQTR